MCPLPPPHTHACMQDLELVAQAVSKSALKLMARVEGQEVLVPVPRCGRFKGLGQAAGLCT